MTLKQSNFPTVAALQHSALQHPSIGKNRHGEAGTAFMHAQLKYCQFTNLDHDALNQIQGMRKNEHHTSRYS